MTAPAAEAPSRRLNWAIVEMVSLVAAFWNVTVVIREPSSKALRSTG